MHEENPAKGARVNVEGFVNTIEQARKDGCETVVYATTSSIYGDRTEPSPEYMAVEARTGYEALKLARERYAEYFHNFHGMTLAGLRFFSVYQGFGGAEEHKGEFANTVAQFTDKIANGDRPELFGDGSQTRDFTHVDDIVRACELAADHELQGIYNVGTAESYVQRDGRADQRRTRHQRRSEVHRNPLAVYVHDTMADYSKLQEATEWKPQIDFEEGVARVCESYQ